MKTIYVYIPDDSLPENGWIHSCNVCYNPTESHINELYVYHKEKMNMHIIICKKCSNAIKKKPTYHYRRFIRKCKEEAERKIQLKQYDEELNTNLKPITIKTVESKAQKPTISTVPPVPSVPSVPPVPINYKKKILDKLDKRLEFNFRKLITCRTKTTGTSTSDS